MAAESGIMGGGAVRVTALLPCTVKSSGGIRACTVAWSAPGRTSVASHSMWNSVGLRSSAHVKCHNIVRCYHKDPRSSSNEHRREEHAAARTSRNADRRGSLSAKAQSIVAASFYFYCVTVDGVEEATFADGSDL